MLGFATVDFIVEIMFFSWFCYCRLYYKKKVFKWCYYCRLYYKIKKNVRGFTTADFIIKLDVFFMCGFTTIYLLIGFATADLFIKLSVFRCFITGDFIIKISFLWFYYCRLYCKNKVSFPFCFYFICVFFFTTVDFIIK